MTLRTLLRERPATLVKSLAAVIGIAALSWGQGAAAETITVTDLAGRTVEVPHGAKKVILGGGRMFYATVMFEKEHPFEQLAAIGDDLPKCSMRLAFPGYPTRPRMS